MLIWPPFLLTLVYLEKSRPTRLGFDTGVFMVGTLLTAGGIIIGQKHLPVTIGPDRDGPRLASCLKEHFPTQRILSTRYQEAALLLLDRPTARVLSHPRHGFTIRPLVGCSTDPGGV